MSSAKIEANKILGTKAETLSRLRSNKLDAFIPEQIILKKEMICLFYRVF